MLVKFKRKLEVSESNPLFDQTTFKVGDVVELGDKAARSLLASRHVERQEDDVEVAVEEVVETASTTPELETAVKAKPKAKAKTKSKSKKAK